MKVTVNDKEYEITAVSPSPVCITEDMDSYALYVGNLQVGQWVYEISADTELDERARSLIIFHYYNGATLKSIADDMNMSYANAKVIHKKALRSLQAALSENL